MTRRLLLLVGAIAVAACPAPRPAPPPVVLKLERPPVPTVPDALEPPQPTLRLPKHFVPAEYRVHLALDPSKPGFAGRVEIAGKLNDRAKVIWLHGYKLAVTLAIAKGDRGEVPLVVTPKGEDLLELRASTALDPGAWTLELSFRGAYETVSTTGVFRQTIGKDAYVYSQFEATFARRAFPCIDEPDTQAPLEAHVRHTRSSSPSVSNAPPVPPRPRSTTRLKRVEFAQTRPLPTYLVAFGVGPVRHRSTPARRKRGTPDAHHRAREARRRGRVRREDLGRASLDALRGVVRHAVPVREARHARRSRSPSGSARWRTRASSRSPRP